MAAHFYWLTPTAPGDHAFCGHVFTGTGKAAGRLTRRCKACKRQVAMSQAVLHIFRREMETSL